MGWRAFVWWRHCPPKLSHIKVREVPALTISDLFASFLYRFYFKFRSLPHASADLPCRAFNLLENGWIFESSVVNPTINHPSNQLGVTLHHPIGNVIYGLELDPWYHPMVHPPYFVVNGLFSKVNTLFPVVYGLGFAKVYYESLITCASFFLGGIVEFKNSPAIKWSEFFIPVRAP